jgi:hypothetical protein
VQNGFSFSTFKTQYVHFACLWSLHPHPTLFLNNSTLPFVPFV